MLESMATGTPLERYEMKVDRSGGFDACHPWTAKAKSHGYGTFRPESGVTMGAHRFGYLVYVGEIPAGFDVDHTCHNDDPACMGGTTCLHRACQNPRHWEAVPPALNKSRGKAGAVNAARLTGRRSSNLRRPRPPHVPRASCKYGHPYPETTTTPGKHRKCLVC